ncbi:MAG: hypothetical protein ACO2OO_01285 [Candidatus Aenigmatarchaeota archaeon]
MYNYNRGVNIYQVSQDEYNGDLKITFIPRGKGFNATSDVNILEQIRKKTDEELTKKGVIIQKSEIKMTTMGNIEYIANYKHRPKQFGISIGAIVSSIINAIIQAIKAIIKFIVNAIKQLISYIKKLTMKLITQLKDLSGRVLGGGSEQKDIDLKDPEGSLEGSTSDDGLIPKTKTAINPLLIAITIIVIAFFFFKK